MPGPRLFETRMGQQFYSRDVPDLVKALERIATALEALARQGADRESK